MKKLKIFGILVVLVFVLGACSAVEAGEVYEADGFAKLGIRINEINTSIEILEAEFNNPNSVDRETLEAIYPESRELLEQITELQYELWEYNLEFHLPIFLAYIQLRDMIEEWYENSHPTTTSEEFYPYLMWAVLDLRIGGGGGFKRFMFENQDLFPDYCFMEGGCDDGLKDSLEHEVVRRLSTW